MNGPLVSVEWLHDNIHLSDLILLDASSSDNKAGLNTDFASQFIPFSLPINLKDFSDTSSAYPNTFPSTQQFEEASRNLGIRNESIIVVYDNLGVYHSPRIWWMFKTMGHNHIYVLDGGLPEWINSGFETVSTYRSVTATGNFKGHLQAHRIQDFQSIQSVINTEEQCIIDARSEDRFLGKAKEPRPGLRSGNIPTSINIPFTSVLKDGKYKSKEELNQLFKEKKVDNRPLIFSCGSGVTACIVLLAAELALKNDTSIYDGSWTEYGSLTKVDQR